MAFQKVDDPTPGKNRIHVDLRADDLDAEVDRLVEAGAATGRASRRRVVPLGDAERPGRQPVLRRRAGRGRGRGRLELGRPGAPPLPQTEVKAPTGHLPRARPRPRMPRMEREAVEVPPEELRLALVLNGGVSLAVWMGGTVREMDALVRADRSGSGLPEGRYAAVLDLARTWASIDVVSGTSAAGSTARCSPCRRSTPTPTSGCSATSGPSRASSTTCCGRRSAASPRRCCRATSTSCPP